MSLPTDLELAPDQDSATIPQYNKIYMPANRSKKERALQKLLEGKQASTDSL